MPHLVAAPDKYRGTADAPQIAAAMARAAGRNGWTADVLPLADGGEGTLEVLGALGAPRTTVVRGPLGRPVEAAWRMLDERAARRLGAFGPTAVIEAARAAGRSLLPRPTSQDPVTATTAGVGELILAAVAAGAAEIVVAVGGTATTDGGRGAVDAVGSAATLGRARLSVACDVAVPFTAAAPLFAPQKGATPAQVAMLAGRLASQAEWYRERFGIDVAELPGAGAGGGLAGGLAALGGRLVHGFDLVARATRLPERLGAAHAVATGEGLLDATSFEGKVVGGVVAAVAGRVPLVCVPGAVASGFAFGAGDPRAATVEILPLTERVGRRRAQEETAAAVEEVVAGWLARCRVP